jgi:hypothetical protein
MSVFAWILLGLVGGGLLGWFSGARGRALLASSVVSMLGAIIGGFLAAVLLGLDISILDFTTLLVAGIGALALFAFQRAIPAMEVFE